MISINVLYVIALIILVLLVIIFKQLRSKSKLKKEYTENEKKFYKSVNSYRRLLDAARNLADYFYRPNNYLYIRIKRDHIQEGKLHYLTFQNDSRVEEFFIKKYREVDGKRQIYKVNLKPYLLSLNDSESSKLTLNSNYEDFINELSKNQ